MVTPRVLIGISLVLLASGANAATVSVQCGKPGPFGQLTTVLASLNRDISNTIHVSGLCRENVVVRGFNRLSLLALPGAVIEDASGGQLPVLDIQDSRIEIRGFQITGGLRAVTCAAASTCRFAQNVIQGSVDIGVSLDHSQAQFAGDIIQDTGSAGLALWASHGGAWRLTIQRSNWTAILLADSSVLSATESVIVNNQGEGVFVTAHSTANIDQSTLSSNGGGGTTIVSASQVSLWANTITGNAGGGVNIGALCHVSFDISNTVKNNAYLDINCLGPYAIAADIDRVTFDSTNCPVP